MCCSAQPCIRTDEKMNYDPTTSCKVNVIMATNRIIKIFLKNPESSLLNKSISVNLSACFFAPLCAFLTGSRKPSNSFLVCRTWLPHAYLVFERRAFFYYYYSKPGSLCWTLQTKKEINNHIPCTHKKKASCTCHFIYFGIIRSVYI